MMVEVVDGGVTFGHTYHTIFRSLYPRISVVVLEIILFNICVLCVCE